jgi:hypothetical protein
MKAVVATMSLSLLLAGDSLAERSSTSPPVPADFALHLPLTVSGNNGVVQFRLPLEVYQNSRMTELADLRLFDATGAAVPFAWQPTAAQHTLEMRVPAQASAWVEGDWVYPASPAIAATQIGLDLPAPNTVLPVQIGWYRSVSGRPGTPDLMRFEPRVQTVFYRLLDQGKERQSSWVSVPSLAARTWVVRPQRAGERAPELLLRWAPRTLLFTARDREFTLAVGADAAAVHALEGVSAIESVAPGYHRDELSALEHASAGAVLLGPATPALADAEQASPTVDPVQQRRVLILWSALLLGVAVLGWMCWRLFAQISPAQAVASDQDQAP